MQLWKIVQWFCKKWNVWPCNSTPLYSVPRRNKSISTQNLYTQVHTAALFTTAEKWKPLKCPSTDEQINTVYLSNGILPSHRKEWSTDWSIQAATRRNLSKKHAKWKKPNTDFICYLKNVLKLEMAVQFCE